MKKLTAFSLGFVLIVIILGAYTRLTDAGLGCPDWPGCYGFLTVPHAEYRVEKAEMRFPEAPLDHFKAWNEMIHRYAAGILGLLVLAMAIIAIRRRRAGVTNKPYKLPVGLLALITFQAALGAWTVTMALQPVIVMLHLMGGFTTFTLLALLYMREAEVPIPLEHSMVPLQKIAMVALVVVIIQIMLGGWVAANYAALACTALPICEGNWWSRLDLLGALTVPPADNYEFGVHNYEQRMTMHVFHRIGAFVVLAVMAKLLWSMWQRATTEWFKRMTLVLTVLLVVQIALGVTNVVASLPLLIAVAHNAVGALLMVALVILNYSLVKIKQQQKEVSHG